jgi:hypothetical protein
LDHLLAFRHHVSPSSVSSSADLLLSEPKASNIRTGGIKDAAWSYYN